MRIAWLAFGCAACSGGVSVDAEVVDATCQITSTGIEIDAEYGIALGVGERLVIDVVIPFSSSSLEEWDCAGWTTYLSGDLELGCKRDVETQAERQVVSHQRTVSFEGSVTSVVITPIVVANSSGHPGDERSVDCTP